MHKELRQRILAFNRLRKLEGEKATDMDILVTDLLKLPPGQLKKIMTEDVLAVLSKYGYEGGDTDGS